MSDTLRRMKAICEEARAIEERAIRRRGNSAGRYLPELLITLSVVAFIGGLGVIIMGANMIWNWW